jgi:exosortase D (VPLPA-CTERM-specific)
MNSFRIGVIGLLVDYRGIAMAEGFLHDFEGWVVFMACAGVLVLEMWVLAKVGRDRMPLSEAFAIAGPSRPPASARVEYRRITPSFLAVLPIAASMLIVSQILPDRGDVAPQRRDFLLFPLSIGGWQGVRGQLDRIYVDALNVDDYLLANFNNKVGDSVQLYAAYYESQRKGASVHSPKSCLPGGGWIIQEFSQRSMEGVRLGDRPLRVNRSLIQLGADRQLVYYWFQQRGRVMTNEYLVKWYLFWDALTKNRTDGALVRLTTSVPAGSDPAEADAALTSFAQAAAGQLQQYIPN